MRQVWIKALLVVAVFCLLTYLGMIYLPEDGGPTRIFTFVRYIGYFMLMPKPQEFMRR